MGIEQVTMRARDLSKDERALIDVAWNNYLDVAQVAVTQLQIGNSYQIYQNTLDRLNVIVTLTGYKVKLHEQKGK